MVSSEAQMLCLFPAPTALQGSTVLGHAMYNDQARRTQTRRDEGRWLHELPNVEACKQRRHQPLRPEVSPAQQRRSLPRPGAYFPKKAPCVAPMTSPHSASGPLPLPEGIAECRRHLEAFRQVATDPGVLKAAQRDPKDQRGRLSAAVAKCAHTLPKDGTTGDQADELPHVDDVEAPVGPAAPEEAVSVTPEARSLQQQAQVEDDMPPGIAECLGRLFAFKACALAVADVEQENDEVVALT
eukprot:TRINITY_DN45258_c0_g1_i3.p1 TRINITY_DN45258_c0_g1~~TRINITY_DN45258_c0_g1_i3.p1  ORF type:complete len:241 (+),score=33.53 TRINITY_DN45258_c0_g1_i3:70-792(+)